MASGVRLLRNRLLVSILGIALLPALALTSVLFVSARRTPAENVRKEEEAALRLADVLARQVEQFYAQAETYVAVLATLLEIKGMNPARHNVVLLADLARRKEFDHLYTMDAEGNVMAIVPEGGSEGFSASAEFRAVSQSNKLYVSAPLAIAGRQVQRISAPIVSVAAVPVLKDGAYMFPTSLAGVVGGALVLDSLRDLFASAAGEGGAALSSEDGRVLVAGGAIAETLALDAVLSAAAQAIRQMNRGYASVVRADATMPARVGFAPVKDRRMVVSIWSPSHLAPDGTRRMRRLAALMGGLSLLLAGALAVLLTRSVSKPMEQLATALSGDPSSTALMRTESLHPDVAAFVGRMSALQSRLSDAGSELSKQAAEITELRRGHSALQKQVVEAGHAKEQLAEERAVALAVAQADRAGQAFSVRLASALEVVGRELSWERVCFFRHDAAGGRLADPVIHPEVLSSLAQHLAIPIGEGGSLLAVAAGSGQPVVGSGEAIRAHVDRVLADELSLKGFAAAPAAAEGKLAGVLVVGWRERRPEAERAFGERVARIAARLGVWVERWRTAPAEPPVRAATDLVPPEILDALQHVEGQLHDEPLELLNDPKRIHSIIIRNMALKKLVVEIQDLARLSNLGRIRNFESVHLAALTQTVAEAFREELAFKQIQAHVEVPADLPELWLDEPRVFYVLTTLFKLSVRATPRGGGFVLRADEKEAAVELRIRHSGQGVPAEQAEQAFRRFHADKDEVSEFSGSGLSLSLVRAVLTSHGGSVSVGGDPGSSTEYVLTFPTRRPAEA